MLTKSSDLNSVVVSIKVVAITYMNTWAAAADMFEIYIITCKYQT